MSPPGPRGILVTRPEPGASETARRLRARGWVPVLAPVLQIVPRALGAQPGVQAILVTSGNAIAALPRSLHATTLFAVGDATAARAVAAGFSDVHSAGADAAALLALVCAACDPRNGPVLLASGEGQGLGLVKDLRAAGFRVRRRVAYAARPAPALPDAALAALRGGEIGAVLVFSPDSARHLVKQARAAHIDVSAIEALAISKSAASPLFDLPWASIRVASHPDQDALLGLLP